MEEMNINGYRASIFPDKDVIIHAQDASALERLLQDETRGKQCYMTKDEDTIYLHENDERLIAATQNDNLVYLDIRQADTLKKDMFLWLQEFQTLFLGESVKHIEKGTLDGTQLPCVYCHGQEQANALQGSGYTGKIIIDPDFGAEKIYSKYPIYPTIEGGKPHKVACKNKRTSMFLTLSA